jgi:hypothetical protein
MSCPRSLADAIESELPSGLGHGQWNQVTTMSEVADDSAGSVILELLDSASGVPRTHAYLEWDAEGCQAVAISSQQLVVDGQRKPATRLRDGDVFRLGAQGCDLKFRVAKAQTQPKPINLNQTLMFDPDSCPILHLDRDQLQREVAEIESGAYFQSLSQTVKKLKQARGST